MADHPRLERGMLWVRVPPGPPCPSGPAVVAATLSRWRPWVRIPPGSPTYENCSMPGTGRVQGRAGRDARPSEGFIGLLKLFTFSRKRTLEKHARGLVLNQTEFVRLIELCHLGLLRLRHGVHYHRPPHPAANWSAIAVQRARAGKSRQLASAWSGAHLERASLADQARHHR